MSDLHIEVHDGHGIPLVLLHGWGMHGGIWNVCVAELKKKFSVIVVDLPGFGHSHALSIDANLTSLSDPIVEKIKQPAIYLGWSLGGLVATDIAYRYPEKVLGLIQVCSTPKFLGDKDWPGMEWAQLSRFHTMLHRDYTKTIEQFILLQLYQSDGMKQRANQIKTCIFSRAQPALVALDAGLTLLEKTDQRRVLSKITCPKIALFGQLDRIVSATVSEKLHFESIVFAKASHMPFMNDTQAFCQAIKKFGTTL